MFCLTPKTSAILLCVYLFSSLNSFNLISSRLNYMLLLLKLSHSAIFFLTNISNRDIIVLLKQNENEIFNRAEFVETLNNRRKNSVQPLFKRNCISFCLVVKLKNLNFTAVKNKGQRRKSDE